MSGSLRRWTLWISLPAWCLAASLALAQRAGNPVFEPPVEVEGLPRVLLIGDSISMGYTLDVRRRLEGRANVHRPAQNCGPTTRGLERLDAWLGDTKWDVIHFNFGLHDLKYIDAAGKLVPPADGAVQVSLAEYERNLRALVGRLEETGARLVWASTTPVPEGARGRIQGSAVTYNRAAERVMRARGVPIDDLWSFANPRLGDLQRPRDVHFTPAGSARLADLVADSIVRVLERPSFLVILCDDLGWGDLGCFGSEAIFTPHLDRLASEGARLTDCYAAAPVCSPSRAGLLTGRAPTRAGIYDWIPGGHPMHLREDEVTVSKLLREAGYATGHFGKWHLNGAFASEAQPQPGDHGFEYWCSTQNNASPSHRRPKNFVRDGERIGELEGYACEEVARDTMRWIGEQREARRPFFAFTCFHEPHEPIASPPDLVDWYPSATQRGEAEYRANVTNMDRAVGYMMRRLDELGLRDETVVIFTSDNGPETLSRYANAWRSHGSPGPLRGMKLHVYEGGIRVPGIVRWPGVIPAGETVADPVSSVDILPTLAELGGARVPDGLELDGASLAKWMRGEEEIERVRPLVWHYFQAIGEPKVALRDGRWKLLGHVDIGSIRPGGSVRAGDVERIKASRVDGFELYDLRADVGEARNLVDERPEVVERLSKELVARYRAMVEEGPVWELPRPQGREPE